MSDRATRIGVAYGLAAYIAWGLFPIYFKLLKGVLPFEVLAHRIIWSAVFLALLVQWRGQWPMVWAALRDRRVVVTLLVSTTLIAINWFTFIVTMLGAIVLQASMGYFINPLVNVLLGYVFLGERLRGSQKISIGLAALGVLCFAWMAGQVPVYPLVLAVSFALYGLLRKTVRVEAMVGLTVETWLLTPVAAGYLIWLAVQGRIVFGAGPGRLTVLLLLAGLVTAGPLLWFTNAARRLRLATIGFMQYISPTLTFFLAVIYGEHFGAGHAAAFGLIWAGLVIYTVDAARATRRAG